MSYSFGEEGCAVLRDNGTPCGRYGQPTELEDGQIVQCCAACRETLGSVRLVHSNYPHQVRALDVRRWAVDKVRRMLEHGHTLESLEASNGGGCGPSRRDHPAYRYSFGYPARRGYLQVELEGEGGSVTDTFRIADLVQEARAGVVQMYLFETAS